MSGISGLAADAVPLSSLSCTDCGFKARRPDAARTRRPCVVGAAEYGWSSTAATRSHTPSVRSGKRIVRLSRTVPEVLGACPRRAGEAVFR